MMCLKEFAQKLKLFILIIFLEGPLTFKKLQIFVNPKKLILVEDCAHAFGGKVAGNYLGTLAISAYLVFRKFFLSKMEARWF